MYRIGQGYDAHRLEKGRRLILGGVEIPYDSGLKGHSDADVLVHALIDALLGAAALGDIGSHFPDTGAEFKNINSIVLLGRVLMLIQKEGFFVQNADMTILAQHPKLFGYIGKMKENIAGALGTDIRNVSVKATTEEGMGFTGSGEGMAAQAIVLLKRVKTDRDA
ncbi:MAG: 2-C-methyl-D-erythritol 2,4-cyclodiphosphate synthase [Clostridiales bacterium]|nr:2-C-methyl-D-erythritol 2,4-cyclodiphosphate synthase [Clostridiales bacterium]